MTLQSVPAPDPLDLPPKRTMDEILGSMKIREEWLESPHFNDDDAGAFVGDLNPQQDLIALKAKVENTVMVVEDAEAYAVRMLARSKRYADKARAAMNKAERIRNRLDQQMQFYKFERLPGNERAIIRKRANSPAIKWLREATPEDLKKFPDFVMVVPRQYKFINAEVKKYLKQAAAVAIQGDECPVLKPAACDFAALEYSYSLVFDDIDQTIVNKKKSK